LLVRAPGGPTTALDFRETAPRSLTRPEFDRMIADRGRGALAVGVPGSVRGLVAASGRFGRLPLARVLDRAIRLARDGHPLAKDQARALERSWSSLRIDPAARQVFAGRGGEPLRAGSKLVQPDLAKTLELIATSGEAGFYSGSTAEAIVRATKGHVTAADLASYGAVFRDPLRISYRAPWRRWCVRSSSGANGSHSAFRRGSGWTTMTRAPARSMRFACRSPAGSVTTVAGGHS
jgi:gamma-glutamyltranspeptidase/glutathione hydrolase